MLDQHKAGGEGRLFDQRDFAGVYAERVLVVDAVGDHFAIGDAAHVGLIEYSGGALVEMHATMPEAVGAHRVEAGFGLGQAGQIHQWVAAGAGEGVAPVVNGVGHRYSPKILVLGSAGVHCPRLLSVLISRRG
ncbi:hypothetical protein D3C84_714280 [compost metagenome]